MKTKNQPQKKENKMTKLQMTIYVTADDVELEKGRVIPVNGTFYFNGKNYKIVNKEIVNE